MKSLGTHSECLCGDSVIMGKPKHPARKGENYRLLQDEDRCLLFSRLATSSNSEGEVLVFESSLSEASKLKPYAAEAVI